VSELVFVKIGGAMATDKEKEKTLRSQALGSMAQAMKSAAEEADLQFLLGHGGGSFGHFPAMKYEVKSGIHPQWGFDGFQITRDWMTELNGKIRAVFAAKGLRLFPIQPSSCTVTESGSMVSFETGTVETLLRYGRVPVLWGDAVLDRGMGFTIISTETILAQLARALNPTRVVIITNVDGVYEHGDDVRSSTISPLPFIDRERFETLRQELTRTQGVDVTGGMMEKVNQLLRIAADCPNTEVRIVNGIDPAVVSAAVKGTYDGGTVIRHTEPSAPDTSKQ